MNQDLLRQYIQDHILNTVIKSEQFSLDWNKRMSIGASDVNRNFVGFNYKFNKVIQFSQVNLYKKLMGIKEQSYEKFMLFALGHFFEDITKEYVKNHFQTSYIFPIEYQYQNSNYPSFTVTPDLILFAQKKELLDFIDNTQKTNDIKTKLKDYIDKNYGDCLKVLGEFKYSVGDGGDFMAVNPFEKDYHLQYLPQIIFGQEHVHKVDLGMYVRGHMIFSNIVKIVQGYYIQDLYYYNKRSRPSDKKIVSFFSKKSSTANIKNYSIYLQHVEVSKLEIIKDNRLSLLHSYMQDDTEINVYTYDNFGDFTQVTNIIRLLYSLKSLSANDAYIIDFPENDPNNLMNGRLVPQDTIDENVNFIMKYNDIVKKDIQKNKVANFVLLILANYSFVIDFCDKKLINNTELEGFINQVDTSMKEARILKEDYTNNLYNCKDILSYMQLTKSVTDVIKNKICPTFNTTKSLKKNIFDAVIVKPDVVVMEEEIYY